MTEAKLKDMLRSMVSQYGFEQVDRSLHEIGFPNPRLKNSKQDTALPDNSVAAKTEKKKAKVTAPEYVAKMELSSEKRPMVVEFAERFEGKTFLPTFGDIRNFCQVYGIDKPASKSRASAIPRIFKFIATMETEEIQRILNGGMFSGPSRLEPIADAILSNSSAGRSGYTSVNPRAPFSSAHPATGDSSSA